MLKILGVACPFVSAKITALLTDGKKSRVWWDFQRPGPLPARAPPPVRPTARRRLAAAAIETASDSAGDLTALGAGRSVYGGIAALGRHAAPPETLGSRAHGAGRSWRRDIAQEVAHQQSPGTGMRCGRPAILGVPQRLLTHVSAMPWCGRPAIPGRGAEKRRC